jgi:hypothetical protein
MKMVAMTLRWHGQPNDRIARRVPKLVQELGGGGCNVHVDEVRKTGFFRPGVHGVAATNATLCGRPSDSRKAKSRSSTGRLGSRSDWRLDAVRRRPPPIRPMGGHSEGSRVMALSLGPVSSDWTGT